MDACMSVEREVDKVLQKLKDTATHTGESLEEAIVQVQAVARELEEGGYNGDVNVAQSLRLSQCLKKVQEAVNNLSAIHKDRHGSVSKVGKAIDRSFVSDFGSVLTDSAFDKELNVQEINQVIYEHFLRQGQLDIAQSLITESAVPVSDTQQEPFLELHHILESLKNHNLEPALAWAGANRKALEGQGSSLEFKLHRLHFIDLVSHGPSFQLNALNYARNFAPFAASHAKELQVLMGTLLYMKQGLDHSPYSSLLDSVHWLEICDIFTRDACTLLGLSVESPLSVVIRAGCAALPPLLNIKQVMQQRQCSGVWSAKDELPVEINLGKECRFHSIFACPILRQQSSSLNPPVRLVCGHVISQDALHKLANGNKVKCPYCPVEQTLNDAKQIFF
ncbi:hypothetical protein NP493_158g01008 [Ridgeia piscesae]|uniref:Uncharacterized protein n=1 Tax=Ridgeia piscesae TaxID=27915 RepID=A0AAD9P482_RIDPI|nr:hypothetical protein NP493_158g01008 [Ridgeia piscesae]